MTARSRPPRGAQPLALNVPNSRADTAARVLAALRVDSPATATDLVAATRFSRPTVLGACDDLINAGWVHEPRDATERVGRGRPARYFAPDPGAGHVIGIDMGLRHIHVASAGLDAVTIRTTSATVSASARARTRIATLDRLIADLHADDGSGPLLAIAVGLPAPVHERGISADEEFLGDLPNADLDLHLRQTHGAHTLLYNDANLAALAERSSGAARGLTDQVTLLAGERLGAGVVIDGRLLHGARGGVGEIGGASLLRGVAGTEGIAPLVRKAAATALSKHPSAHPVLSRSVGQGEISSATVFAVAEQEPATRRLLHTALRPIARVVASLHLLLDPQVVIIGGGVASAPGLLDALHAGVPALEELRRRPLTLATSTLGADAVVQGAVAAAADYAWASILGRSAP